MILNVNHYVLLLSCIMFIAGMYILIDNLQDVMKIDQIESFSTTNMQKALRFSKDCGNKPQSVLDISYNDMGRLNFVCKWKDNVK